MTHSFFRPPGAHCDVRLRPHCLIAIAKAVKTLKKPQTQIELGFSSCLLPWSLLPPAIFINFGVLEKEQVQIEKYMDEEKEYTWDEVKDYLDENDSYSESLTFGDGGDLIFDFSGVNAMDILHRNHFFDGVAVEFAIPCIHHIIFFNQLAT